MKSYLKLSSAADDDLINSMLSAATIWGENYTRHGASLELIAGCF